MSSRTEYAVVPGSRLDFALAKLARSGRRDLLAIMAQRMPATKFAHVIDADTHEVVTTVLARRTKATRRQRKWIARVARAAARRGVEL